MKKSLYVIASLTLFLLSLFYAFIFVNIAQSEVMPALQKGTFMIDTNTMILNRVWEGNEIYLLLTAHTLLAIVCAYFAFRIAKIVSSM